MNVLAFLPDDARRTLHRAIGQVHTVARASDVRSVLAAVRARRCHALVLDPVALDDDELEALRPILDGASVPVVLYTELTPDAARRIVKIAAGGAHELVLRGAEDEPALLLAKLDMLLEHSAPAMLLNRVASHLASLPSPLQKLTVGLFGRGPRPRWVRDVAYETGCGRRTIDRWMGRVGIRGTATLLDAARLAHVWEPLVEHRRSAKEVGALCGYEKPRMLNAHARRLLGVMPSQFATRFTRHRFVDRLTTALLGTGN